MSIDKFHAVVGVLQKTQTTLECAIPNFRERLVFAEPPALTGVLINDLQLRLLLQTVEREPVVSFTIQANGTRIDGYFGGRPIFLWAGKGTGFEGTVYVKDLISKSQGVHIPVHLTRWYGIIEEICRIATGNIEKPVARLVGHERTTHSTLQRFDTLPAMPVARSSKVA